MDDDELAERLRARITEIADGVRAAISTAAEEICGVALFALDDDTLDIGHLFALTTRERDAAGDAPTLLSDPATWTEYTPDLLLPEHEGRALATALTDAGCFEPETAVHREVADRLRAGPWPGTRVSSGQPIREPGALTPCRHVTAWPVIRPAHEYLRPVHPSHLLMPAGPVPLAESSFSAIH